MKNSKYKITYIANAGVLIEDDKIKIMIDGIHTKNTGCFSSVSKEVLEEIMNNKKLFKKIDYLLFTHYHPDHIDIEKASEYLERNKNTILVSPKHYKNTEKKPFENIEKNKNIILIDSKVGEISTINFNNIKIKFFKAIHDGEDFININNYCYIIYLGSKTFLHLGDSKPDYDFFNKILNKEKIDYALLNFPYSVIPKNREIISNIISPKKSIVIHLPFKKDDQFNYRQTTLKVLKRYNDRLPDTTVFLEPMQELVIS